MRRVIAAIVIIATAIPLSGCYVGPGYYGGRGGGGNWCYWHPERCRR